MEVDIPLGTVWLERGKTDVEDVLGGILLRDPLFFGRGIGRRAIACTGMRVYQDFHVLRVHGGHPDARLTRAESASPQFRF